MEGQHIAHDATQGMVSDGRDLYFPWRDDVGDLWVMDAVKDEGR